MTFDAYKLPATEVLKRLKDVGLTYVPGPEDNHFDCCTQLIFSHPDGTTWTWNGSWWSFESVRQLWAWAKARYPVDESPWVKP